MGIQRFKSVVLGLAVAAVVAGPALAGPTTLKVWDTDIWGQDGDAGYDDGGPFEVEAFGIGGVQGMGLYGADAGHYLTFCVETKEFLLEGETYDVDVNVEAIKGGVGGDPDPLDARTAFLYTAFLKGTLATKLFAFNSGVFYYFDGAGTPNVGMGISANALQNAIWNIEEEATLLTGLATKLLALADAAVDSGGSGEWYNKWGLDGIGNVRILNMWKTGTDIHKQDILILIPLPIPAAMALVGLLGVGVVSTRRRWLG